MKQLQTNLISHTDTQIIDVHNYLGQIHLFFYQRVSDIPKLILTFSGYILIIVPYIRPFLY